MPIAYRSILRIPHYEDYYGDVEQRITAWFGEKQLTVSGDQGIHQTDDSELSKVTWHGATLIAHRWTLRQDWPAPTGAIQLEGRPRIGATTVSLVDQGDSVWFWVDVDAPTYTTVDATNDEVVRTQWAGTPRIVRSIIDDLEPCDGEFALKQTPSIVESHEQLFSLLTTLHDTSRIGAVLVSSPNGENDTGRWLEGMKKVSRDVAGMAQVHILSSRMLDDFNFRVGDSFSVPPGTIRTFLPGADFESESDRFRHRLLGRKRLDTMDAHQVSGLLRHSLVRRGRELRVPEQLLEADYGLLRAQRLLPLSDLRDRQATARVRRTDPGPKDDLLQAQLTIGDLQQQVDTAQSLVEMYFAESARLEGELIEAREDSDLLEMELEQATQLAGYLQTRVKKLQGDLVRDGRGAAAYSDLVPEDETNYPDSFSELYELIATLDSLQRCDIDRIRKFARKLDDHPSLGTVVTRAWDGLLTLSDYAKIRKSGEFDGGLHAYLRSPHHAGRRLLYGHKGNESETVQKSERMAGPRTVAVPTEVDASGQILMTSHMALATGRAGSPRLYFYDNVGGDGQIYIGYVGEHLRNTRTN